MWNDTDIPIAFMITFRTYGTWLHGDARGSTNRFRNKHKTPLLPKEDNWLAKNQARLAEEPFVLNGTQRKCAEQAIRETCLKRGWILFAINVRTNHVHVVVGIGEKNPSTALNAFKANATRRLRSDNLYLRTRTPWADKGSQRWLWTDKHLATAIDYVENRQGDDLPEFD